MPGGAPGGLAGIGGPERTLAREPAAQASGRTKVIRLATSSSAQRVRRRLTSGEGMRGQAKAQQDRPEPMYVTAFVDEGAVLTRLL